MWMSFCWARGGGSNPYHGKATWSAARMERAVCFFPHDLQCRPHSKRVWSGPFRRESKSLMLELNRRRFSLGFAGAFLVGFVAHGSEHETRSLLAQGQAVVYFRHGATTWSGIDRLDWPRERQRLLSQEGVLQSQRIGQAFREQNLPVGEVLASPFARCRDMAEIAFGYVEERIELVGLLSDNAGRDARVAYLRERLSAPTDGRNRIIVSHRSNIAEVAQVSLSEGDGVVVHPNTDSFDVLAVLTPWEW